MVGNEGGDDKDDKISRRRTLQGLGAVIGASAIGCGEDPKAGDGDTGSSSGDDGTDPTGNPTTSTSTSTSTTGADETGSSSDASSSSEDGAGSTDDTTGGSFAECEGVASRSPQELLAPIETIVVVMMENRSFDHYFGSATFREGMVLDGLTGDESNPDPNANPVSVFNLLNLEPVDPPHGWDACHAQWNMGANDGFVQAHASSGPSSMGEVMGYHVRGQLPVLYAMMDNYVVCDRWFASVMGPTWPNRFYMHSGTSGSQKGNVPVGGLTKIWDQLADAGISGRNYYSDLPWAWGGFASPFASYTDGIDEFFAAAASGNLPSFVIIDPHFGILPGGGNDDHPSHNITLGQMFLATIHQALATSPQWDRCLLIITYDEHGGFYDHVPPPTMPDEDPEFQQLGFRVPAIIAGPFVRRGCVDSTLYDHVSVLATASARFGLPPINARAAATNDVSWAINPDYLSNPQEPARIPQLSVSVSEALAQVSTSQHELRDMVMRGELPLPHDRRDPDAGRRVMLSLLHHAQRLGVAKLRP